MNRQELEAFAKEAAKSIKTPDDLNQFSSELQDAVKQLQERMEE